MNTTTSTSRPVSSIHGSSNTSSIELPPLPGLSRHNVLPEEWTLPHEWKMEKRELFEAAKDQKKRATMIYDHLLIDGKKYVLGDDDNGIVEVS
ncbi:hypothetical protein ACOMHN_021990 [Nucella lapillus]